MTLSGRAQFGFGLSDGRFETGLDDAVYRILNPDLRHSTMSPEKHYRRFGKKEGRRVSPEIEAFPGSVRADPQKENLVIVSPDAGYGASTTALALSQIFSETHNIYSLFGAPGPTQFRFIPFCVATWLVPQVLRDSFEAEAVAEVIAQHLAPEVVLTNSISSWPLLPFLGRRFVPTVTLVHEFADYVRPSFVFDTAFLWSTKVVFPAELVVSRARELNPQAMSREYSVIPQAVPDFQNSSRKSLAMSDEDNLASLVIGAGTVSYRKGVDLFIEACRTLVRKDPSREWRFRWIGPGFDSENDLGYGVYLRAQIESAGLQLLFEVAGPTDDFDRSLEEADLFLLSSRLDPFPNVAVEAMRAGVPVVCFEGASGVAQVLQDQGLGKELVAEAYSADSLADKALRLLIDPQVRKKVSDKIQKFWAENLTLDVYGSRLLEVMRAAGAQVASEKAHALLIDQSDFVDMRPGSMLHDQNSTRQDAIVHHGRAEATGIYPFRPEPGFNPVAYGEGRHLSPSENRYAHYLLSDRPDGDWRKSVVDFSSKESKIKMRAHQNLILHVHAHYRDVLAQIMEQTVFFRGRSQLIVSVTSGVNISEAREIVEAAGHTGARVLQAPESGRNFASFLSCAQSSDWDQNALVCHLHTKKTPQIPGELGREWLNFLLTHLVGKPNGEAIELIAAAFSRDTELGLVFPADPLLVGVGGNEPAMRAVRQKYNMGHRDVLGDFPVGGMFWMRGSVAKSIAKRFDSLEFEPEPLADDGATAHAVERLLPQMVESEGFHAAVTFSLGVRRE